MICSGRTVDCGRWIVDGGIPHGCSGRTAHGVVAVRSPRRGQCRPYNVGGTRGGAVAVARVCVPPRGTALMREEVALRLRPLWRVEPVTSGASGSGTTYLVSPACESRIECGVAATA